MTAKAIQGDLIRVVPAGGDYWRFEFPRVDQKAEENLRTALGHFDAGESEATEKVLHKLLERHPEFIDAHHHYAMTCEQNGRPEEAMLVWFSIVSLGNMAIPRAFKRGSHTLPWAILDNRPFLRAYHSWGLVLLERGHLVEALAVFRDIMALNPNDNQGVRALIVECHFRLGDPGEVVRFCEEQDDDTMEDLLFGYPLALIQLQRTEDARKALKTAVEELPLIAEELLKKRHRQPKGGFPGGVLIGGADQAFEYWERYGELWEETEGALALVRSIVQDGRERR